ncbi:MAG TPA: hypothetical protein VIY48_20715 [Candidatus Paceibacterota bacterium]
MDALVQVPTRSTEPIRQALRYTRRITAVVLEKEDHYFRLDRRDAAEYLWDRDDWKRLLREYFESLRNQGERVVYVDICGRTDARSFGVERNYSFSLQPVDFYWIRPKDNILVQGDIFSARDFYSFVNLLRANDDYPAWVVCEPVAGLQSYTPRKKGPDLHFEVTYQRLANNLRKMLEIVRPGGYVFLECPFQGMNFGDWFQKKPVEEYESSLWIKDFAKRHGCTVRIKSSIVGPRYLLRKRMIRRRRLL